MLERPLYALRVRALGHMGHYVIRDTALDLVKTETPAETRRAVGNGVKMKEVPDYCQVTIVRILIPGHDVRTVPGRQPRRDLKGLRMDEIIGIKEDNILAASLRHAEITRIGQTAVRLVEQDETRIGRRILPDDGTAAVRAAVVDTNRLPVRKGPPLDRIKTAPQILLNIIDRDNYLYCRHNLQTIFMKRYIL